MAATPTANNEAALPPEPVRPKIGSAAGSECGDACTFEIYRREKAEYEALNGRFRRMRRPGPKSPCPPVQSNKDFNAAEPRFQTASIPYEAV